jgi:serine/threonine protein kinase
MPIGNEVPRGAKGGQQPGTSGARVAVGSSPVGPGHVGRYRLLKKLESTSTATMYEGSDTAEGAGERRFAIKVIHAHLSSERSSVEAFFDEARIAARLDHPCAARIVDFGDESGGCYIATELAAGEPLTRFIDAAREHWHRCSRAEGFASMPVILKGTSEEPADPRSRPSNRHTPVPSSWSSETAYTARCLRLARDICDGLHAAHQLRGDDDRPLGIVLGDLSPEAILVRYDGSVQLEGFSFGRPQTAAHDAATGVFPARFAYMAPEQFQGAPPDPRTNVWTLGVILWELLTRQRLFPGGSPMQTAMAIADSRLTLASDANPALPNAIDALLSRALDRNPRTRFATALQFGQAIDDFSRQHAPIAQRFEIAAWMRELFPEALDAVDPPRDDARYRDGSSSVKLESAGSQLGPEFARANALVSMPFESSGNEKRDSVDIEKRTEAVRDESEQSPSLRHTLSLAIALGVFAMVAWSGYRLIVSAPWARVATPAEATKEPRGAPPALAAPASAAPAPPLAAPAASGTVYVTSKGEPADIYMEGKLIGRTPAAISLPAGSHALDLRRKDEESPFRLLVLVQPGMASIVSMPDE